MSPLLPSQIDTRINIGEVVWTGMLNEADVIDTTFNMYSDTPEGGDPDARSPTLRRYHKLLWSKPLPCGTMFDLDASGQKPFLRHKSELGEFKLSSDAITQSYRHTKRMADIIGQLSADEINQVFNSGATIGSYTLFPANRVAGTMTINGARGCNFKIGDRFDLTLECIRRYYRQQESPLSFTLSSYGAFFDLFENFRGYVDFFLLHDLVSDDYNTIKFYLPLNGFERTPYPATAEEYRVYRSGVLDFIAARNRRIEDWCQNPA